eukprot:scaffold120084_cov39-Prasinocladus_malaysianus.AAC.1
MHYFRGAYKCAWPGNTSCLSSSGWSDYPRLLCLGPSLILLGVGARDPMGFPFILGWWFVFLPAPPHHLAHPTPPRVLSGDIDSSPSN